MKLIILVLCCFISFSSNANAGTMYNCIDRDGNTIFTDIPQAGMKCDLKNNDLNLPLETTNKESSINISNTSPNKINKNSEKIDAYNTREENTMLQLIMMSDVEAAHTAMYERCLQINPVGAQSFKKVIIKWGEKNYPAIHELRLLFRNQLMKEGMDTSVEDAKESKRIKEVALGLKEAFAKTPAAEFQEACSGEAAEKLTSRMDYVALLDKYRSKIPVQKGDVKQPKANTKSITPFASKAEERFINNSDGTVLDTKTNLMWAAKDNGSNINWTEAKYYCENYRVGGYTDWRMPTQNELARLYDVYKTQQTECSSFLLNSVATDLIHISCFGVWAKEIRGSDAAIFDFLNGRRSWWPQSNGYENRALPVRISTKFRDASSNKDTGKLHEKNKIVHVIGVYEGDYPSGVTHGGGFHPDGKIDVLIKNNSNKASVILVLMSYEPVNWHIKKEDGAEVEQVILSSYYPSKVTGLDNVPVLRENLGYEYKRSALGSINVKIKERTGSEAKTFQGEYHGKYFDI